MHYIYNLLILYNKYININIIIITITIIYNYYNMIIICKISSLIIVNIISIIGLINEEYIIYLYKYCIFIKLFINQS